MNIDKRHIELKYVDESDNFDFDEAQFFKALFSATKLKKDRYNFIFNKDKNEEVSRM